VSDLLPVVFGVGFRKLIDPEFSQLVPFLFFFIGEGTIFSMIGLQRRKGCSLAPLSYREREKNSERMYEKALKEASSAIARSLQNRLSSKMSGTFRTSSSDQTSRGNRR
jgi:hypothetical protein